MDIKSFLLRKYKRKWLERFGFMLILMLIKYANFMFSYKITCNYLLGKQTK